MAARRSGLPDALLDLGAIELRDRLARGAMRAGDLAEAALARIAAREPEIGAFAWHDPDFVRHQARAMDEFRATGRPIGALHGIPVALKDIVDTARIPTENGTALDAGRVPSRDAWIASRLKSAGAILIGKTVTTELAYLEPASTRNPAAPGHTPGGSSAGSAASVAAGMTPLAIGTQTGGSVIRPAAFCGVVGFKPSFGAIPRTGILPQSPTLDTVGVFARGVEDAALLADALFGHDPADPASRPAPHPRLLDTARSGPPLPPVFAFLRPPGWDEADPAMRDAMKELAGLLGTQCFEIPAPPAFAEAAEMRERINLAEMAKCYFAYERRGMAGLSTLLREAIERGKAIPARDYIAALDWPELLNAGIEEIFTRCDAILTPAALGPAPHGLGSTGSAIMNGVWTLCGTPAITLPLLEAEGGLPMGVQLIGRRHHDARLLRTARWLETRVSAPASKETTDV